VGSGTGRRGGRGSAGGRRGARGGGGAKVSAVQAESEREADFIWILGGKEEGSLFGGNVDLRAG